MGELVEARSPFQVDGEINGVPNRVAPGLGEHTDEILHDLGHSEESINELRQNGTVA